MKKLFLNVRVFSLFVFLMPLVANAQIWVEDFDGSNTTNPINFISAPCGDDRDYYQISCIDNAGCPNEINGDYIYNNANGQFMGVRDIDTDPCTYNNGTIVSFGFNGIDVSSCPGLSYVCFSIAESRNMGGAAGNEWGASNGREDTWDEESFVNLSASVDGGGFSTVTSIVNTYRVGSTSSRSDGRAGIDVNCSGMSGEAGEPEITDTFTKYCFNLPTSGSTLDLLIEFGDFNGTGEDFALDNFEVHCGTPTSGTVLPSCSPFVSPKALFYENFDGGSIGGGITFRGCQNVDGNSGKRDYFDIMCQDGGTCPNTMNDDYVYVGLIGQFFGARDFDGVCGGGGTANNQFLDANGIDISGCGPNDKLYICLDMAESSWLTATDPTKEQTGSVEDTWDNNSYIHINATTDAAPLFPVAAFESVPGSNNNTGPAIDTNCDGEGDGPALTETMTTYCFEIAATGNTLDVEINIGGLNTGGEDIAIDNIVILCTDDLFCVPGFIQQSCTAPTAMNVPTMGEWALFILFLLMVNLAAVFMMAMQSRTKLATPNGQNVSMANVLRSASFDKQAFTNALKHAFGLAIVGFAIIYIGWGEIVFADIIGMLISIPLVAYFIHLFYTKE